MISLLNKLLSSIELINEIITLANFIYKFIKHIKAKNKDK